MGYTTDFSGQFNVSPALKPEHMAYLTAFAGTRRMSRDRNSLILDNDPIRLAAGLPLGVEGGYFVGSEGFAGQTRDASVLNYNSSPSGQPGLWCQWIPNDDGTAIVHDGGEKFYSYVEWIQYLIEHFLQPWGYKVNGKVNWSGEEQGDVGVIVIKDNIVKTHEGKIVFEEELEEVASNDDLGQVAYEAYVNNVEWPKIAFAPWVDLSDSDQNAWRAVAKASIQGSLRNLSS